MPLGIVKRRQWIFIGVASFSVLVLLVISVGRWNWTKSLTEVPTTNSKVSYSAGLLEDGRSLTVASSNARSLRKPGALFEIQFSNISERGRSPNKSADLRLSVRAQESVKDVKLKWNFPSGISLRRGEPAKEIGHLAQGESFVTDVSITGDSSQPQQIWVEVTGDQDGQRVGVVENHLPFREWRDADQNAIRELNRRFRALNGPDAESKAQR